LLEIADDMASHARCTIMSAENRATEAAHLAADLRALLGSEAVRSGEPVARYTALRIGGPADLLVVAAHVDALRQAAVLAWEHHMPCQILGGGSNVLVSDAGVRGLVVLNRARAVSHTGTSVKAESGTSFSTLARQCVARGLAGLEWATGIPGSVGGAVVGNAGAWGGDVASTLLRASILEPDGVVHDWPVERFAYDYRTSILKRQAANGKQQAVVLEAEFALQAGEREALKAQVAEITVRRKASQPPGATCGSVFKNPPGDHAGRLLETAGLKGQRSGAVEISPVHANFFVNHGHATAADVKALIDRARRQVHAMFGVVLELEIQLIGEW
jgi:UDP-N-acetylmuramate dehydrogenase